MPPTPRELGYRFPAEWEERKATWLSWPHNRETWPHSLEAIQRLWWLLMDTLSGSERVSVLVSEEEYNRHPMPYGQVKIIRQNIIFHKCPTNDAWLRDCGPTFLKGHAGLPAALIDWKYNAWGEKFPPYDADDAIPKYIARFGNYRRFEPGIVMEGGSVETDGEGTLLTTENCLLNPNRNPHLKREEIEEILREYLSVDKIIWLQGEIAGDDTDGHIDQLTRFVCPGVVVTALEEDPQDENYQALKDNYQHLMQLSDARGRALEVIPLPMPRPIFAPEGHRLPASYANFYIGKSVVIVPSFEDPADAVAGEILQRLFPQHAVFLLPARELVYGCGAFHCITQQEPA
ncbi:Porphyromonas-type peptidyl-arginine deiminase [Planctomycetales bacterium 10988]|nr:Porphyromonas-type peptidyl-arginine deiminase [Planctomycetales bacterium 10988]